MEKQKYGGVDLHCHSHLSDGRDMHHIIYEAASVKHLDVLSITDHNVFAYREPELINDSLLVVPGCEFDSYFVDLNDKKESIHILGIWPEGIPRSLDSPDTKYSMKRDCFFEEILTKLRIKEGICLTREEVESCITYKMLGRSAIADTLVHKHICRTTAEAYERFLSKTGSCYVDVLESIDYPCIQETVNMIVANNGIPVLAHALSYNLSLQDFHYLLHSFKSSTRVEAIGLEVYYSRYTQKQHSFLQTMATKYCLYPTAGSDSHSEEMPLCQEPTQLYEDLLEAFRRDKRRAGKKDKWKMKKNTVTF